MNKYNYRRRLREDVEREAFDAATSIIVDLLRPDQQPTHALNVKSVRCDIASRVADRMLKRFRMIRR